MSIRIQRVSCPIALEDEPIVLALFKQRKLAWARSHPGNNERDINVDVTLLI